MRGLGAIIVSAGLGCLSLALTPAVADIRLSVASIETPEAKIENLSAVWSFDDPEPRLDLRAGRIQLPSQAIEWVAPQMSCRLQQPAADTLVCSEGLLKLPLPRLDRQTLPFTLRLTFGEHPKYLFDGPDIRVAGGRVALSVQSDGVQHRLKARGQRLSMPKIWGWTDPALRDAFQLQQGRVSFQLNGQTSGTAAPKWEARLQVSELAGESPDGLRVLSGLGFNARVNSLKSADQYQIQLSAKAGEAYVDPVYLSLIEYPVEVSTRLDLRNADRPVLRRFEASQQGVGHMQGEAHIHLSPEPQVSELKLTSIAADLASLNQLYLLPFGYGTMLETLTFSGRLAGDLHWRKGAMVDTQAHLQLSQVDVKDAQQRIELVGLELDAHWNRDRPSQLSWRSGRLLALELGALDTKMRFERDQMRLLAPLHLPLFDGELQIDRLQLSQMQSEQRQLEFEGYLTPISLTRLTEALGWAPMQGKVSGVIPSMTYQSGTLELGGNLLVRVFDGQVLVQQMTVQGLFSDYPILHADIRLNNLDLGLITTQFDFGSIEGRLGGHVNKLVLENWKPVAFDAWLGTPEGDRSRHRISQRAIENISDLGGVGVAGLLSRGFMRFFDTFSYKRIAIGCVLSNGICEVKGVIPAQTGYYLVQGGGLPRINIIGHNRKILWRVFLQRLERVLATE